MAQNKPSIALALIVKNEEEHLDACLRTVVDWVDEIVILDSGSRDQTREVALAYTHKYYVQETWPGFGPQRRIAQTYIQSDYVLWLDADERITPELRDSIEKVLANPKTNTVYAINRSNHAFGRTIRHGGWYPDHVVRLYATGLTQYDDALVHEKVEIPEGVVIQNLSGNAIHYPYKNLGHYLSKSARYARAWADRKKMQGKTATLAQGISHGMARFVKMYLLQAGFLDGRQGLLISLLSTHSVFLKYAQLWLDNLSQTD